MNQITVVEAAVANNYNGLHLLDPVLCALQAIVFAYLLNKLNNY